MIQQYPDMRQYLLLYILIYCHSRLSWLPSGSHSVSYMQFLSLTVESCVRPICIKCTWYCQVCHWGHLKFSSVCPSPLHGPRVLFFKFLCTHNNIKKGQSEVSVQSFCPSLSVFFAVFAWLTIHPTVFLRLKSSFYDDQSDSSTSNWEKPNIFNRSGFRLRGFVVL